VLPWRSKRRSPTAKTACNRETFSALLPNGKDDAAVQETAGISQWDLLSPRRGCGSPSKRSRGAQAAAYHLPEPKSLTEEAWLVDWNGKLLKTVTTRFRNTSGMAVGAWYGRERTSGRRFSGGYEIAPG
jgi:hypothetical protein